MLLDVVSLEYKEGAIHIMAKTLEQQLEEAKKSYKEFYTKNKKHRSNWKVQERLEVLNEKVARLEGEMLKRLDID